MKGVVLAGHARLAAASSAGLQVVPTVRASGLTEAQKRAYVLADNKLAEKAGWDRGLLSAELGELALLLPQIDLDLTLTGFEPPEIDAIFTDRGPAKADPVEDLPVVPSSVCSQHGDLWCLGPHRCGCIEVLGNGDERDTPGVEDLHQLGEVRQ